MSYGQPTNDRFFLGLEQLEVCRELLLADTPAKARMAVILLDGLADALLYRHLEDLYRASEEPFTRAEMPRYPKKLRREAKMQFGLRVELARKVTYWDEMWRNGIPPVDDLDAAVLNVGHTYRNDAYHRDRHNAAVIDLVGKAFYAAVARVFVRAQPSRWGIAYPEPRLAELERFGVTAEPLSHTYRDAAEQATATLLDGVDVSVETLAHGVADDLEARADEAEDLAGYLPEAGADLDESLARYEVWSKHAADEDVLALQDRIDPVMRARREGLSEVPEDYYVDGKAATKAFFTHMRKLEATSTPTVSLRLIDEAREAGESLRTERDLAALMTGYHAIDVRLRVLEQYLGEAVSAYDEAIQQQIDLARGK